MAKGKKVSKKRRVVADKRIEKRTVVSMSGIKSHLKPVYSEVVGMVQRFDVLVNNLDYISSQHEELFDRELQRGIPERGNAWGRQNLIDGIKQRLEAIQILLGHQDEELAQLLEACGFPKGQVDAFYEKAVDRRKGIAR